MDGGVSSMDLIVCGRIACCQTLTLDVSCPYGRGCNGAWYSFLPCNDSLMCNLQQCGSSAGS